MGTHVLRIPSSQAQRNYAILGLVILTALLFGPSLKAAANLAMGDDRYLQVLLAPLMCALLLWQRRVEIFPKARYSPRVGLPVMGLAAAFGLVCVITQGAAGGLLLPMVAVTFFWTAGFYLCCGPESLRAGIYPLSCLLLMIPLPARWMDWVATVFQHGSAVTSYWILKTSGIPVLRHGMVISLPGLDFEVAPECSGIRSSLALLMVAIVVAYLCLRSGWTRGALLVLTIPIVVFKNAVRIAGISSLGVYVNRSFLDGPFHHRYGGPIFSVVGVILFLLVLAGLQRLEAAQARKNLPQR